MSGKSKVISSSKPAFAKGGTHQGGWAMVGEQGPELAFMPPARIYSAPQTQSMLGSTAALESALARVAELEERLVVLMEAYVQRDVKTGDRIAAGVEAQVQAVALGGARARPIGVPA